VETETKAQISGTGAVPRDHHSVDAVDSFQDKPSQKTDRKDETCISQILRQKVQPSRLYYNKLIKKKPHYDSGKRQTVQKFQS